jgi:hypothetical protein
MLNQKRMQTKPSRDNTNRAHDAGFIGVNLVSGSQEPVATTGGDILMGRK